MTNEEAIKELKEDRALYESDIVETGDGTPEGQLLLALDMAIEALEKQIKKKPREAVQSGFFWCPACSKAIKMRIEGSKINISYCPFCGQALDWRETE